jgi:Ca2+-binding RTX toxin-like protein
MKPTPKGWTQLQRLLASAMLALAGIATNVMAATIGINGSILTATADGGDDVVVVSLTGTNLTFDGTAFTIVTPGCNAGTLTSIVCSVSNVNEVRIVMGAGDDVLQMSGVPDQLAITFIALGQAGNDIMVGTAGAESMYGGAGDDVLIGFTGILSCGDGGTGNNVLIDIPCGLPPEPTFPPATPTPVPAPSPLALLAGGLALLGVPRRRARAVTCAV